MCGHFIVKVQLSEEIMKRTVIVAIFPLLFLFLAVDAQTSHAESSQPLDVNVKNFPETQQVKGTVFIEGTTSHSKFIKREAILVPPSRRSELSELTFSGIVETDGFTSISINVQGEIKSASFISGAVGVLLIPDEDPIIRAFREAKRVPFSIEIAANLKSGETSFFDSEQTHNRIVFPRYKMFLYNTTNKAAEANIYLYLSN